MFIRYPETIPGYKHQAIAFNNVPYAAFVLDKSAGKKDVFLTSHTLLFVRSGEKLIHQSGNTQRIGINTPVLLKRGIYAMSEYVPQDGRFEALLIFIPDIFFVKQAQSLPAPVTEKNSQSYFLFRSNDLLNSFIAQYLYYFDSNLNSLQYLLDIKLQELFLLLNASARPHAFSAFIKNLAGMAPPDMEYVVREHLFRDVTIPDLALLSARSLPAFKREFKTRFGMPPRQWINRQRLEQAGALLVTGQKTVAEVAYACGYDNVSYFIRLFKLQFGETPARYMQRNKVMPYT